MPQTTNTPDGDGQFDFPYLTDVDDPISYDEDILDIIAATGAHQRGMSQGGASGTDLMPPYRWLGLRFAYRV